jgi:hypothetical protein
VSGPKGPVINDLHADVHRQVHPNLANSDGPTSQAFMPTKKDKDLLSVADGRRCSPADAYRFHSEALGFQTIGTWSIRVADVNGSGEQEEVLVYEDPITESEAAEEGRAPDPNHASIDLRGRRYADQKRIARELKRRARQTHPPQGGPTLP